MNRKNNESVFKAFILTSFIVFLLYLLFTKRIMEYVHPRIIPFIIISSVIMLISVVILLSNNSINRNKKVRLTSYLIYIIPIMLFFIVDFKNLEIVEKVSENKVSSENVMIINGDNFKEFLQNKDNYLNNVVQIKGFYHIDENKNEYIARNFMACCAADMQIVGIECKYTNEVNVSEGTWVIVEGIIKKEKGKVIIELFEINLDDNPDKKYIY